MVPGPTKLQLFCFGFGYKDVLLPNLSTSSSATEGILSPTFMETS